MDEVMRGTRHPVTARSVTGTGFFRLAASAAKGEGEGTWLGWRVAGR